MKHAIKLGRAALLFLPLFCGGRLVAAPLNAEPAPEVIAAPQKTLITRDNFVSFWWSEEKQLYKIADSDSSLVAFEIKGNVIHCKFRNEDKTELTATLSNNQLNELIDKLNQRQPNRAEQREEHPAMLFTLFFSDKNNEDQNDNFAFFDDAAKPNIDLQIYLRNLVQMKFIELFLVEPEPVN